MSKKPITELTIGMIRVVPGIDFLWHLEKYINTGNGLFWTRLHAVENGKLGFVSKEEARSELEKWLRFTGQESEILYIPKGENGDGQDDQT